MHYGTDNQSGQYYAAGGGAVPKSTESGARIVKSPVELESAKTGACTAVIIGNPDSSVSFRAKFRAG